MNQKIVAFDQDELGDWRAGLVCGHYQHVRHRPPLESREWVLCPASRHERIGMELDCKHCDNGNSVDADQL